MRVLWHSLNFCPVLKSFLLIQCTTMPKEAILLIYSDGCLNNSTISNTDDTVPADALVTLGARAPVSMLLSTKPEYSVCSIRRVNTLRPRQNRCHFANNIFKYIFFNENAQISLKISLKFIPKGPINNIPALVQIMAWRRPGDKPLSEPMMVSFPTHICVTRPQWVNTYRQYGWHFQLHFVKKIFVF